MKAERKPQPVIEDNAAVPKKAKIKKVEQTHFDFTKADGKFQLPPFTLLDGISAQRHAHQAGSSHHQFPYSGKEAG